MTNFMDIADLIRQCRQRTGVSQEQLVQQLVDFQQEFADLDVQALSRWERGAVTPSLARQVLLMQFFGESPEQLLADTRFSIRQLPSILGFDRMIDQALDFRHMHGAHPYLDRNAEFVSVQVSAAESAPIAACVANYQQGLARGRETWDAERLASMMEHPSCRMLRYDVGDILGGHLLYARLKRPAFEDVLRYRLLECQLSEEHMAAADEPSGVFVVSTYGGSKPIIVDHMVHMLSVVAGDPLNSHIALKAHTEVGGKFFALLDASPVALGSVIAAGKRGLRYRGKRYQSATFAVDRQRILGSALYVNLLRRQVKASQ